MKATKSFATVVIAILLFASVSYAQFTSGYNPKIRTSGNIMELTFTGTLDSTGGTYNALTSNQFEIPEFSSLEYMSGSYEFYCAAGAPKIFVDLLGSNTPTSFNTFSAVTYPLVAQIIDTTTSETRTNFASVFGNIRTKYYKLYVKNADPGRDNAKFEIILRFKLDKYRKN